MVTDLSSSNVTRGTIQTLAEGRADVDCTIGGVNYHRFQFVDFSTPILYFDVAIFGGAGDQVEREEGNFRASNLTLINLRICSTYMYLKVTLYAESLISTATPFSPST